MQLDRDKLKIQALLERISEYENRIADLRVELTVVQNTLSEREQELSDLKSDESKSEPEGD